MRKFAKKLLGSVDAKLESAISGARTTSDIRQLVEEVVSLSDRFSALKRRQLGRIKSRVREQCPDLEDEVMARLVDMFTAEDIDHIYVKNAKKYNQLESCSSFRACVTLRSRRKLLQGAESCPEWLVDHKVKTYQFADLIGVRRPWQKEPVPFKQLRPQPGSIVKPVAGAAARGVYAVLEDGSAFDVNRGEHLSGWEEAQLRAGQDIELGRVTVPNWIEEELIKDSNSPEGIAKDIKFLCFYGKAVLVREFARVPERADNWWDEAGHKASVGKLLEGTPLGGEPPPREYYDLAERISSEIPAPFMRIDFVTSDDGLVLNEFTPRPGTYHQFNQYWDRRLGDAFLEAEARLTKDLLGGKSFKAFEEFVG